VLSLAWSLDGSKNDGKPNVCLLVPHYGFVSLEWVDSTYAPFRWTSNPMFNKSLKMARGIQNLDTERNVLVQYALEEKDVTHMLFLDTDCIMEKPTDINQAIAMLLQCKVPIVSGLYRAKKKEDFPYAMWITNPAGPGYLPVESYTGNWLNVDVIGFGFVLLERQVFEKVPQPWFTWGEPQPSEDFAFCEKAKKHGFDIRVYTDVKLSHSGTLKVLSDGKVVSLSV